MKLYEINERIRTICESGIVEDQETGEVLYEGPQGLESLEMERTAKVLAISKVIKELGADLEAYETERKALANRMLARSSAMEKRVEWLKGYLVSNCEPTEKLKDATISVGFRVTESVEYVGEASALPDSLRKVSYTPDKTAIKYALAAGEAVEGASIISKVSPSIR